MVLSAFMFAKKGKLEELHIFKINTIFAKSPDKLTFQLCLS